jgi:hypothetical protein
MNIRHEVLDWFRSSRGVIVIRPVLIYYSIEIDSLLFLFLGGLFNVDLSSLCIVSEPSHIV